MHLKMKRKTTIKLARQAIWIRFEVTQAVQTISFMVFLNSAFLYVYTCSDQNEFSDLLLNAVISRLGVSSNLYTFVAMVYYIRILDISHRPVFYSKHDDSETEFCRLLQVKPIQFGSTDRASSLSPNTNNANSVYKATTTQTNKKELTFSAP
jgi:hypothetical protein